MTHLVPLQGEWAIWRWAVLRGAGMPVDTLEGLACAPREDDFSDATVRIGDTLRAIGRDPLFREALVWQNRHALATGVDVLLARPATAPRTSKYRQKEALVASYVQRYCAKNDTIGFFGPVGWARTDGVDGVITADPGPTLLASRATHLEAWAVDGVVGLDVTEARPRMMPYLRLDGTVLHLPLGRSVNLTAQEAAVLTRCDGRHTPDEIAVATGQPPETVNATLNALLRARRISCAPTVPDGLHPEAGLGGPHLDRLCAHRDAVAAAAGDPDRLDDALRELEEWFSSVTSSAATRRAGETHAGRALVYEDCCRDITVSLGPRLRAELGPPLELVLIAARWFTGHALRRYRRAFDELYERLFRRGGTAEVPFPDLWLYAQELLFGNADEVMEQIAAECRRRWATVLGDAPAGQYSSRELRAAVQRAFPDPGRLPPITRYCCPDVMVAAPNVAAMPGGDHRYVLGEMHAGMNTLATAFFVGQHPDPDQLSDALAADLLEPQVVAVHSRAARGITSRMTRALVREQDLRLVFAHDSTDVPEERALPTGSLVVSREPDGLVVASRDGRWRFDLMDVVGELVMVRAHRAFQLVPAAPHNDRVTIDRLVVARERWSVPATDASFAWDRDEERRYHAARRWAADLGLPRRVFVQASRAVKPIYVDFDSPPFVDLLCRTARRAQTLSITEMLPTPDNCWLTDSDGRHYTSELRLVAIMTGRDATA